MYKNMRQIKFLKIVAHPYLNIPGLSERLSAATSIFPGFKFKTYKG
jgi:hypothetical protein